MIVVSEIGEQWSPHTAPAMQADTQIMARVAVLGSGSVREKALNVIGIRIPNVPQDVPVAKDNPHAIRKMIAGMIPMNEPFDLSTISATYSAAPKESVIALRDHASVRIRIGGTIALKPSSMLDMHSLNLRILLHI